MHVKLCVVEGAISLRSMMIAAVKGVQNLPQELVSPEKACGLWDGTVITLQKVTEEQAEQAPLRGRSQKFCGGVYVEAGMMCLESRLVEVPQQRKQPSSGRHVHTTHLPTAFCLPPSPRQWILLRKHSIWNPAMGFFPQKVPSQVFQKELVELSEIPLQRG